ncbi:hypothetical protein [Deinococcus misasensis]|uniref:hypothetical protein n=1 Tax=Deinococcus misasensis TaxID=392413 RepID=UPI0012F83873|nr:hypothetical protein [Deinococcus misasensis]
MAKNNRSSVPDYLVTTVNLLRDAGIMEASHSVVDAMIYIISEHISDRNLAQVLAYFPDYDYYISLNRVYQIESIPPTDQAVLTEALNRLKIAGLDTWLAEE